MDATGICLTIRETRRATALDRMADHMLAHGLAPSTLRALGDAAGVSDRMLLYYFADKDDIVTSALQTIAARMAAVLASIERCDGTPATVLAQTAGIARSETLRPFMRVWLELVVLSARGERPYRQVAGLIAEGFVAWVGTRLTMADDAARHATATRLVALIDGLVLLDCVGCSDLADAALQQALTP